MTQIPHVAAFSCHAVSSTQSLLQAGHMQRCVFYIPCAYHPQNYPSGSGPTDVGLCRSANRPIRILGIYAICTGTFPAGDMSSYSCCFSTGALRCALYADPCRTDGQAYRSRSTAPYIAVVCVSCPILMPLATHFHQRCYIIVDRDTDTGEYRDNAPH